MEAQETADLMEEMPDEEILGSAELEKAIDPEGPPPEEELEEQGQGEEEQVYESGGAQGQFEDDSVQGFFDHSDDVFSVAVHPIDASLVVSGGGDDRAFLWNAATGEKVAELGGHTDSVAAVAWNFDGAFCATGGLDGVVKVWDEKGTLVQTLEGPSGGVSWLLWHPRGNALLAGSEDCSTWLWLAPVNKNVAVFFGHAGPVECGAWSADGKLCVTGSEDCAVKIWSPKSGQCLHSLQGHEGHQAPVVAVGVSQSGMILSGDSDGGLLLASLDGKIKGRLLGHSDSVECIVFSPQLPLAATGAQDGTLRMWDLDAMSCRQVLKVGGGVLHLKWHPTRHLLLSANTEGKITLYEPRTLEVLQEWHGPLNTVNDIAVSADWTRFVTVEDGEGEEDGEKSAGPCLVFDIK